MNRENLNKNPTKITSNSNFMSNIRNNLYTYLKENTLSVRKFADITGLPVRTINNVLYGNTEDCKLSTAIAIAKAMNVSIAELADLDIIEDTVKINMKICRHLPDRAKYLIRWFIKHQYTLYNNDRKHEKIISVMIAECTHDMTIKVTNIFNQTDLSTCDIAEDIKNKVFFGLQIPCECFMPVVSPYDILLIANDRVPINGEKVVVLIKDTIFLATCKYENGILQLYGLRDNRYRCTQNEVDEIVGYIPAIIQNDIQKKG